MANTMTFELNGSAVESTASGLLARVQKTVADYRLYRATLTELEQLNDRELQDLGISRFAIREIAYDSVYGA